MNSVMLQNMKLGFFINEPDRFEFLNSIKLDLSINALQKLSTVSKITISFGLGMSLLVGSYFKSAIYVYMYEKRKNLTERPINVLLLVQAIVQHLISSLMIIFLVVGLNSNAAISEHLGGEDWCNIEFHAGNYGFSYRVVGGLGIACYRLLCLFASDWVKYKIGSNILLCSILSLSFTLPTGLILGFATGNGPASRKQAGWNLCIGKSEELRNVLHEYSILRGTTTPEAEHIPMIMISISLLFVMAELVCYVVFFGHYYLHDKEMLEKKILKADVIKRRNQKNAITFLGQFWTFMTECIMLILIFISLNEQSDISYRVFAIIGFWIEFGLVSVVEVCASVSLVNYLPHRVILRHIS